jgi:hypothetical protein
LPVGRGGGVARREGLCFPQRDKRHFLDLLGL